MSDFRVPVTASLGGNVLSNRVVATATACLRSAHLRSSQSALPSRIGSRLRSQERLSERRRRAWTGPETSTVVTFRLARRPASLICDECMRAYPHDCSVQWAAPSGTTSMPSHSACALPEVIVGPRQRLVCARDDT